MARVKGKLKEQHKTMLRLLVQGMGYKQIGYSMGLAEGTVRNQLVLIRKKLGAETNTQAVVKALQLGEITFEEN